VRSHVTFQSVTRHSLNPGGPGGTVFVFLTFLSTKLLLLQPQLAQITGAGLSMGVGQQAAHEQSTIARSAVVTILIACMSWRSPVKCLCEDEKSDFKRSLKCCVLFDTRKISKHQYTRLHSTEDTTRTDAAFRMDDVPGTVEPVDVLAAFRKISGKSVECISVLCIVPFAEGLVDDIISCDNGVSV
jgi:hypothetical protein